jgi:hypothetical protein
MQLRIEPDKGANRDDSALNAFRFECKKIDGSDSQQVQINEGIWGDWIDWKYFPQSNFMKGAQVR